MTYRRSPVKLFELPNLAYAGASAALYRVSATNTQTTTLIPLFAAATGGTGRTNPIRLDSYGRAEGAYWFEEPFICVVSGSPVGDHETGITYPWETGWKGDWTTSAAYLPGDIVREPGGLDIFIATTAHTSGVWADDVVSYWQSYFPGDSALASATAQAAIATAQAATATAQAGIATTQAGTATTQAGTATTQAGIATTQAGIATAQAVIAGNYGAALSGTSTTSQAISLGSVTLTTQADKQWQVGQILAIASDSNPTGSRMTGSVTAYSGTSLTVNVTQANGAGTFADWSIFIAGEAGAAGPAAAWAGQATGTPNAITLTSPGITSYTDGLAIDFRAAAGNLGSVTVNVNGLGDKALKLKGASLAIGQLAANQVYEIRYIAADNGFELAGGGGGSSTPPNPVDTEISGVLSAILFM